MQTLGIRSAGIGIAIKIADGASRAIRNARGIHAGDIRAVFELTKAN